MTARCFDKAPNADGIIGLSRHILAVRLSAVHSARIRGKSENVGMQPFGHGVEEFQVTVDVGGLYLSPPPIFLHQFEERHEFRLMFLAPFTEENHRHIVQSGLGFVGNLEDGQPLTLEEIFLEIGG